MGTVYVSFRREDTADVAARLLDRLRERFGVERVLDDESRLQPGQTPGQRVDEQVRQTDVMLVVIGPRWASIDNSKGQPRLGNPNDFVRREIELAVALSIPIVPVLVYDTQALDTSALPPSLSGLSRRQMMRLRTDPDFEGDVQRLIAAVEAALHQPHGPSHARVAPVAPPAPGPPLAMAAPTPGPIFPFTASAPDRPLLRAIAAGVVGAVIVLLLLGAGIAVVSGRVPFDLLGFAHRAPTPTAHPTAAAVRVLQANLPIACTDCKDNGPEIVVSTIAIDQVSGGMTWTFVVTNHTRLPLTQSFTSLQIADPAGAAHTPSGQVVPTWTLDPGASQQISVQFPFIPQPDVQYVLTLTVAPPTLTYQPLSFTLSTMGG